MCVRPRCPTPPRVVPAVHPSAPPLCGSRAPPPPLQGSGDGDCTNHRSRGGGGGEGHIQPKTIPHVALIILTVHMFGGNGAKSFRYNNGPVMRACFPGPHPSFRGARTLPPPPAAGRKPFSPHPRVAGRRGTSTDCFAIELQNLHDRSSAWPPGQCAAHLCCGYRTVYTRYARRYTTETSTLLQPPLPRPHPQDSLFLVASVEGNRMRL